MMADSLTISGVFTTGVLLQIWFPFKSFLAIYPKGGNMLSVKIQNAICMQQHVWLKMAGDQSRSWCSQEKKPEMAILATSTHYRARKKEMERN